MRSRVASITLAAALAAVLSASTAQAGMNNLNVSPGLAPRTIPDVKVRPHMIDVRIQLHCYFIRERNELGVWVTRRHCN